MSDRQNAHLTFKGNVGAGRHGWLRLTPAYSVRLVRDTVGNLERKAVVTDPFSGTGTTALAAAEHGSRGQALDVNPFLVWFGNAKVRNYSAEEIAAAKEARTAAVRHALDVIGAEGLWQPSLHQIGRWWSSSRLEALKAVRHGLDDAPEGPSRDLLLIAFCRTLIKASNAAFNHQSMSFKGAHPEARDEVLEMDEARMLMDLFVHEADEILNSAAKDLPGESRVALGDSRVMSEVDLEPCDLLYTSPPYANRMSYIRELRPYMYWTRFLDDAAGAGELDWQAIGGTWGMATSRLNTWTSREPAPISEVMEPVCQAIARDGGKSGPLLATYVRKYFDDMWEHFQAAYKHVKPGGRATYIIGNSTFYGHVVPAELWYALLLHEAGFRDVGVRAIRKRNSKKELFEYDVTALRP